MENFEKYLELLSSTTPSPGGGSCCCNVLCLAVSVLNKSVNITMARKSFEEKPNEIKDKFKSLSESFNDDIEFLKNAEKMDTYLFSEYMRIRKIASEFEIDEVLMNSVRECYKLFNFCYDRIKNMQEIKEYIVASIMPDYYFGIDLTIACLKNCIDNIQANLKYIKNMNDEMAEIGCTMSSMIGVF